MCVENIYFLKRHQLITPEVKVGTSLLLLKLPFATPQQGHFGGPMAQTQALGFSFCNVSA